jgi:hypothetical protein
VFLPTLVVAVPVLVLFKGGDALSVCFNTIAILFLTEVTMWHAETVKCPIRKGLFSRYSVPQIDNAAYAVGLSERVRTRVEEFGRVELRDAEAAALVRSKAVHVVLLVVAVPAGVWSANADVAFPIAFLTFWLGGVAEAVAMPGAGAAEKIKGVGKATGAVALGLISFNFGVLVALTFFM